MTFTSHMLYSEIMVLLDCRNVGRLIRIVRIVELSDSRTVNLLEMSDRANLNGNC